MNCRVLDQKQLARWSAAEAVNDRFAQPLFIEMIIFRRQFAEHKGDAQGDNFSFHTCSVLEGVTQTLGEPLKNRVKTRISFGSLIHNPCGRIASVKNEGMPP